MRHGKAVFVVTSRSVRIEAIAARILNAIQPRRGCDRERAAASVCGRRHRLVVALACHFPFFSFIHDFDSFQDHQH